MLATAVPRKFRAQSQLTNHGGISSKPSVEMSVFLARMSGNAVFMLSVLLRGTLKINSSSSKSPCATEQFVSFYAL